MKQVNFFSLTFYFLSISFNYQIYAAQKPVHHIVESKRFADALTHLTENPGDTVYAFDLDNTVMYPASNGLVGGDHWFRHNMSERLSQNKDDYQKALTSVLPTYIELQKFVRVQPTEPDVPEIIKTMQQKGIPLFALTARHAEQTADTRRQLAEMGVDFSTTNIPNLDGINGLSPHFSHHNGIIHCPCPPGNKGDAIVKTVDYCGLNPKKIVLIDDTKRHLEAARAAVATHLPSTSFTGIHYTQLESITLDPQASTKELNRHFKARYWDNVRR